MIFKIYLLNFIFFSFLHVGCEHQKEFKKLEYDWREDYRGEISTNFKPSKKYDSWAFLRSNLPNKYETITVLFQKNEIRQSIKPVDKSFLMSGHPMSTIYYIATINDSQINYIDSKEKLLDFFGKIDTKEEALMLALIEGFYIDDSNWKGGSYKELPNNGYEFLLMKSIGEYFQRTQYRVHVNSSGDIEYKKGEIYCKGYKECSKKN